MKLTKLGKNVTEVDLGNARILFSYQTPVAAYVKTKGYLIPARPFDEITTKHINLWLDSDGYSNQPKAVIFDDPKKFFDNLVETK